MATQSLKYSAMLGMAVLVLIASTAQAGPITFNATGILKNGSSLSGSIIMDTTLGTVQSLNLIFTGTYSFTISSVVLAAANTGSQTGTFAIEGKNATPYPFTFIELPVTTLVGYTGGSICSQGTSCAGLVFSDAGAAAGDTSSFSSGSLTATPEPGGIVLVGSAMLGLFALRRRYRSARDVVGLHTL